MEESLDILGLSEVPEDRRALRKAYAKKLRTIRADEDPEGFMKLRDALEHIEFIFARNIQITNYENQDVANDVGADASLQRIEHADINNSQPHMFPNTFDTPSPISSTSNALANTSEETYQIYKIIDEAISITQDPWKRNNLETWKDIFERADLEDIDNFAEFENAMRHRFAELAWEAEQKNDSAKVWREVDLNVAKFIFITFQWNLGDVGNAHIAEQVDYIRRFFNLISKHKRSGSHHNINTNPHPPMETESWWNPDYIWIIVGLVGVINIARLLFEN